jgi:hypothetical protein
VSMNMRNLLRRDGQKSFPSGQLTAMFFSECDQSTRISNWRAADG